MTETMYAGKMPILALRGLAVFPDQTVHFDVGRAKSVQALDAAMKQDQTLFLIPQKDMLVDDPRLIDLYAVGTVAKVKQVLKTQGENLRVLVTGICRGKIAELSDLCESLEADLVVFDCELSPSQIKAIEDDIKREFAGID